MAIMVTCSAETGGLYGSGASLLELGGADGKQREGESDRRALPDLSCEQRAAGDVRLTRNSNADTSKQEVSLAGARGSQWKLADGESLPACTIQDIFRIATRFIFRITFKFVW